MGAMVEKAGHHFTFLKKAGRQQKWAGRRALQKRPRQDIGTAIVLHPCYDFDSNI